MHAATLRPRWALPISLAAGLVAALCCAPPVRGSDQGPHATPSSIQDAAPTPPLALAHITTALAARIASTRADQPLTTAPRAKKVPR